MALRATQQYAEALQSGDGVLRITEQFVQVLINELEQFVNQSLVLTQDAAGEQASNIGSHDLALVQTAQAVVDRLRTVSQSLALVQDAQGEGVQGQTVEQSLNLQQTADVRGPISVAVGHNLSLSHSLFSPTKFGKVAEHIPFVDRAGRVVEVVVAQSVTFVQEGFRANAIRDELSLSESISAGKGGDLEDDLGLTHTAVRIAVFPRSLSDALDLHQGVTYSLVLLDTLHQYSPFVGTTTDPDAPTPPSLTLAGPNEGILAPFQLLYPHTGTVTDSVSIRAPNLGNRDRLSFDRIHRETRGGTLIVFANPSWPKIQTLVLNFSGLKRTEALELVQFMKDHLGVMIGLVDWEQRYWEGVIVSPQDAIVADHHDSYSASFSFEGVLSANNPEIVPGTTCAGTAKMAKVKATRSSCLCIPETNESSENNSMYSAESDATVVIGAPLYLTGAGHVNLAQANAAGTTQVAGFASEAGTPGVSVDYITEGKITKSDWTDVAGTANLTVGAIYFLSPTTAGRITTVAPSTVGQYAVKVGRATSATVLDLEIEPPIRL